jgi:hypothetical protein
MDTWQQLHFDPILPLLSSDDRAVQYFTRRDLLDETVGPIGELWTLAEPQKLVKKQHLNGSWPYRGNKKEVYPAHHYNLAETWRNLRVLVDQYEFTAAHPAVDAAAEFLLSCQTDEGDIRGMIGNQYATYYTGAMLALLIKAGYQDDPRIEKGINWLLSMRQDDGGWTVPILTVNVTRSEQIRLTSQYAEPVQPDRTKPFSHNWTGMVLRAFAAHPQYRHSGAARQAATLLKTRFFQADCYPSYQSAHYWVKFDYPYWWNHLLSALDTISAIGLSRNDDHIRQGLDWFTENQQATGLWRSSYTQPEKENAKTHNKCLWISLAICRVLKRLFA